jgi:hypothetical protein
VQCPKESDDSSCVPIAERVGVQEHCFVGNTSSNNSITNSFSHTSDIGLDIRTNEDTPRLLKRPRPDSPATTATTSAGSTTTATTSASASWRNNDAVVNPSLSVSLLGRSSESAKAVAATTNIEDGDESVSWRNNESMITPSLVASSIEKSSDSESTTAVATSSIEEGNEFVEQNFAVYDTLDGVTDYSSDGPGSEGGDDLHCTQIVDLFEDDI